MNTNRIKGLVSQALGPAYIIMIASLVVRSLAAVVATSIPYENWPLPVRLGVEVFAVIGMIICSEIILSAAASSWAVLRNQIKMIEASDEYKPSPRLKGDALTQRLAMLNEQKAGAVARVRDAMRMEVYAMLFGAAVSTLYGGIFAITTAHSTTLAAVVTDIVLCGSLPFVVFYLSALYKPEHKDPAETAQAAAVAALDKQVADAGAKLLSGDYDRRHTDLLEAAISDSPIHHKMVRALAPADMSDAPELSVPEVYATLGVTDKTGKASVRRVLRKAGEAKRVIPGTDELMVRWDEHEGVWYVRQAALAFLYPGGYKPEQRANTPRTGGEQGANTPRTSGEPVAISAELAAVMRLAQAGLERGGADGDE